MKLKERVLMGLIGFSLAIFMLLLLETSEFFGSTDENGRSSPFHGFIKGEAQFERHHARNLQKTASGSQSQSVDYKDDENLKRDRPSTTSSTVKPKNGVDDPFKGDSFNDVLEALDEVNRAQSKWRNLLKTYSKRKRKRKRVTLAELADEELSSNSSVYERFQLGISDQDLYDESDKNVDEMLHQIATKKFERIVQKDGGTQFKLIVTLEDGGEALFKPSRFPREQVRKAMLERKKFKFQFTKSFLSYGNRKRFPIIFTLPTLSGTTRKLPHSTSIGYWVFVERRRSSDAASTSPPTSTSWPRPTCSRHFS